MKFERKRGVNHKPQVLDNALLKSGTLQEDRVGKTQRYVLGKKFKITIKYLRGVQQAVGYWSLAFNARIGLGT